MDDRRLSLEGLEHRWKSDPGEHRRWPHTTLCTHGVSAPRWVMWVGCGWGCGVGGGEGLRVGGAGPMV
jgi:hypothetical protein